MDKPLEAIATVVTIVGVYLISEQHLVAGWIINGAGDLLWIWWGYVKTAYYLIALQLILFAVALNGLHNAL